MSDSYLDHLSTPERERIRKRMRSPEAYEMLREKVKGPEDLEREMKKNERMAEIRFQMESEPAMAETMKATVEKDIQERGVEQIFDQELSKEAKKALMEGKFTLTVTSHPKTHQDVLVAIPEGHIQEKLPIKPTLGEEYVRQFFP